MDATDEPFEIIDSPSQQSVGIVVNAASVDQQHTPNDTNQNSALEVSQSIVLISSGRESTSFDMPSLSSQASVVETPTAQENLDANLNSDSLVNRNIEVPLVSQEHEQASHSRAAANVNSLGSLLHYRSSPSQSTTSPPVSGFLAGAPSITDSYMSSVVNPGSGYIVADFGDINHESFSSSISHRDVLSEPIPAVVAEQPVDQNAHAFSAPARSELPRNEEVVQQQPASSGLASVVDVQAISHMSLDDIQLSLPLSPPAIDENLADDVEMSAVEEQLPQLDNSSSLYESAVDAVPAANVAAASSDEPPVEEEVPPTPVRIQPLPVFPTPCSGDEVMSNPAVALDPRREGEERQQEQVRPASPPSVEEPPPGETNIELNPVLPEGVYGKLIVLGRNGAQGSSDEYYLKRRERANGLCESAQIKIGSDGRRAGQAQPIMSLDTSVGRHMASLARHEINLNHPEVNHSESVRAPEAQSEIYRGPFQNRLIANEQDDDMRHHSQILFTVSRVETQMVQFRRDSTTDQFQIGRAVSQRIDLRVDQQQPLDDGTSMVSRWACRIVVSRDYPHQAKIYAAGFDDSDRIFLGEGAKVWKLPNGHVDGLTTNGILICKSPENASQSGQAEQSEFWREVSVRGNIYPYRLGRNITEFEKIDSEDNILTDGTLIDLSGIVLMWRNREGLTKLLTDHRPNDLRASLDLISDLAICPVLYNKLELKLALGPPHPGNVLMSSIIPARDRLHLVEEGDANDHQNENEGHDQLGVAGSTAIPPEHLPFVYTNCGHVSSLLHWGQDGEHFICPLCKTTGPRLRLRVGGEPSFWRDIKPQVTHAFTKCAHGVSEQTARFWSKLVLPRDSYAICPFCGYQLESYNPYFRLFFQSQDQAAAPAAAASDPNEPQQGEHES